MVAMSSLSDDVLAGLDPEQREVATSFGGPVCVIAGAGTGKTRAITHRIAHGVHTGRYTPQNVLAVTFTARAASEMRSRLSSLNVVGVQARTFHAAALRQLQFFWAEAIGGSVPEIVQHKARLVAEAAKSMRLTVDAAGVRDLAAEIEWCKVSMLTHESYADAAHQADRDRAAGWEYSAIARLIAAYDDLKAERYLIDFEDVLLVTLGMLRDHDRIAAAVRRQYKHFVVDEFQDVSAVQYELLKTWMGDGNDLCVVGDPAQTIYTFAGADARHLTEFNTEWDDVTNVRLHRNYRSDPAVIAWANTISPQSQLTATKPAATPPNPPTVTRHDHDEAEAAWVAESIRALVSEGTKLSSIAVLFRTNGQSAPIEQALSETGVGYLVRGGERFFARREVRDALALLRSASRREISLPFRESVCEVLTAAGWTAEPAFAGGAQRQKWESLNALVGLADTMLSSWPPLTPGPTLGHFVDELARRQEAQHAPEAGGVTLASLHAAKGLEWDVVFLVGASEGLLPIHMAQDDDARAEERRLAYVGVTRATSTLRVSWAAAKTPDGRAFRSLSSFFTPFVAAQERAVRRPRSRKKARVVLATHCRECGVSLSKAAERKLGRCEGCPSSYDENFFEKLRAWRKGVAHESNVPAFVVFTDSTLKVIAEVKPVTRERLLAIPGVGEKKLDAYGEALLSLVAEHTDGGVDNAADRASSS